MKKSKMILGLAAATAALLFATACSNNDSGSKDTASKDGKKTLYFIPTVDQGYYWSPMKRGAEETAKKLGYNLVVKTSPSTEADKNQKHIGFIKEAIANKAAGIAVSPMEANIFKNPIKEAMAAKIPVITFDSDLADEADRTAYIGTNNELAGEVLGKQAAEKMKADGITKGSIAIVCVDRSQPNMIAREKGLKAGFEKVMGADAKNFKFLETIMDNDQAAKSKEQLEGQITANKDLVTVFSLGSEGPDVGVMEAIKSQDKVGKILHFGFDYTPTWEKGTENGLITGIVDQDVYKIGVELITNLDKVIKGEKIESVQPIDVKYVEAKDIAEYGKEKEKQMTTETK